MTPLLLSSYTATTTLGHGLAATLAGLRDGRSGLKPCDFETVDLDTWIGEVAAVDAEKLPESLARYDCRNNRLAQLALEQDGFGDHVRSGDCPLRQKPRRHFPRHQYGRHPANRASLPPA